MKTSVNKNQRIMKNIYLIVIILCITTIAKAQQVVPYITFNDGDNTGKYFKDFDNNFAPFIGTWEYTQGNETFRVILSKTTQKPYGSPTQYWKDKIEGKFYLIEDVGTPNETIICQSEKYYSQSSYTTTYVINAGTLEGVELGGDIWDNCNAGEVLNSHLEMNIINPAATTLVAQWKVFRKGLTPVNYEYSFPNNIILTKQ